MHLSTHGILARPTAAASFSNTKSVDFDGVDDYVSIGNPTELQITGDITVSAWIKVGTNTTQVIFGKDDGTNNSYIFYLSAGKPAMVLWTTSSSVYNQTVSGTTVGDGSWHHLMWVKSGSNYKIYIDGSLSINQSKSAVINNSSATATIGSRIRSASPLYTTGKIDEVAVWNSDQSGNIGSIYSASGAVDLSSLSPVLWYRMGDGDTFPTLTDNGSGSNDGTMTNMVSGDIVTDVP